MKPKNHRQYEVGTLVTCPLSDTIRQIINYDDDGLPVLKELTSDEVAEITNTGGKRRRCRPKPEPEPEEQDGKFGRT